MYPGVGPDGVYRLHSGVTDRSGRYSDVVLADQLNNGGNKIELPAGMPGEQRRRTAKIRSFT